MTQQEAFQRGSRLLSDITRLEITAAEIRTTRYPIKATIQPNSSVSVTVSKAVAGRLLKSEIARLHTQLAELKKQLVK